MKCKICNKETNLYLNICDKCAKEKELEPYGRYCEKCGCDMFNEEHKGVCKDEVLTKDALIDYCIDKFNKTMFRKPDENEIWIIENTIHHTLELLNKKGYLTLKIVKDKKAKKQKTEVFEK